MLTKVVQGLALALGLPCLALYLLHGCCGCLHLQPNRSSPDGVQGVQDAFAVFLQKLTIYSRLHMVTCSKEHMADSGPSYGKAQPSLLRRLSIMNRKTVPHPADVQMLHTGRDNSCTLCVDNLT